MGSAGQTEGALCSWRDHLPSGSRLGAGDLLASGTLLRAWAALWDVAPEAPVLRDAASIGLSSLAGLPHRSGAWWSGEEFEAATRRAAGRLATAGLLPGDRVLWSTGSSVASIICHVGALRAGLVVVPANTAYTRREIDYIVSDVGPAAAIVDDPTRGQWASDASHRPLVVAGPDLNLPDGEPIRLDAADPEDPALICFTSGTTGAPKGAVLSHRNLLAATRAVNVAWRWTPTDRLIHCLPVFHAHGLCVGIYGTLLSGGSALLLPGFEHGVVAEVASTGDASLFFGVPTMYHRLARSGRAPELGRLRLCVSGSAPLPADLHRQLEAITGMSVLERYGMTETLMNASNPYHGERRPGTVGFPLPGVDIALGEDGEINLRGPNVFGGYWQRLVATAEAFVDADDGGYPWFRTGDLGTIDDGYLTIRGRSKELIISGGFNVYPSEVEEVVVTHPGVAEVAVTGTPSQEWGEVVTAWIVADGRAPSADELSVYTAERLAAFKRPRIVHVVGSLPRNALGKVVRNELGR
ncbi:MAG: AMP-binding protein [Acidimicrobiales bacterium]